MGWVKESRQKEQQEQRPLALGTTKLEIEEGYNFTIKASPP